MTRRPLFDSARMRITSKGRVTVPKALRERFGIPRETELRFVAERSKLVLVKDEAIGSPDPREVRPFGGSLTRASGLRGARTEQTAAMRKPVSTSVAAATSRPRRRASARGLRLPARAH